MTTGQAAVLLTGILAISTASASESIGAKTFPAADVRVLVVQTDGGAITLNVSAGKTVSTEVSPAAASGDDCAIAQDLREGTLTLTARSGSKNSLGAAKPCAAGFTASAPAGVEIEARSRSGSVEFGAFSGKADVLAGSGAIVLHHPSGALTLHAGSGSVTGTVGGQEIDVETGSGSVDLRGLTGSVKARSGSGAVALAWAGAPQSGNIDVRTGSGDFTATLPADARLKISMRSGSGDVSSDFSSDASAPLSLTFRSGSGAAALKRVPVVGVKMADAPK